MENFSHSRHPNRATAAFSKKICGNAAGGFAPSKSLYDDVYGGPPKFGVSTLSPRMEDYGEIFGSFQASRASSIPVLDLPAVDEAEVYFDVRSSSFDYSEVFGGFNGLDFAVSYEELVDQSKGMDGDSSDEPWSPAEFESLSEESDISGKDRSFSNGSPHHSLDGSTEFNISYHKTNQMSNDDFSNGTTHVTQLHGVSGFSVMVDSSPLQEDEASNVNIDLIVDKLKAKHLRKTLSHPPNGSAGGHAFENDLRTQKGSDNNGFFHREAFVGISEINLRTQPSELPPPCRPPPIVDGEKGGSSKLAPYHNCFTSEGFSGDDSPPFFDVEVDASSSAAVSAAAIKEAMENAQAKIKSARELREKIKDGLQTSHKSGLKKDVKGKEGKRGKIIDGSNRIKDEIVKGPCEKASGSTLFVMEEKQKVTTAGPEVPEYVEPEKPHAAAQKYAKDMSEKEICSNRGAYTIDEASEWKEATEFFELITTEESKKVVEQVDNKNTAVQNTIHEHGQLEKATVESFDKHSENGGKQNAATEDHGPENPELKQGTNESFGYEENHVQSILKEEVCEQKDGEDKVKVTNEVCEWGEVDNSFTIAKQLLGSNKRSGGNKSTRERKRWFEDSKVEQPIKLKENDKISEADKMIEIEEKCKLFHESVDIEEKQTEAFEQNISFEGAFDQEENEKKVQKDLEQEENQKGLNHIFEKVESERRPKVAAKHHENGMGLKQSLQQEIYKKTQKQALKLEEEKKREKAHKREANKNVLKSVNGEKETRKNMKAYQQEINEKRFTEEGLDKEDIETKLSDNFELLDTQNMPSEIIEQEKTKQVLKDPVGGEAEKDLDKADEVKEKIESSKEVKLAKGAQLLVEEDDLPQFDVENKLDCSEENSQSSQSTSDIDENSGKVKTTQGSFSFAHEESGDIRTNEMQPGAVGRKNKFIDNTIKAPNIAEKYFRTEGAGKDFNLDNTVKKTSGEIKIKPKVSETELEAFEIEIKPSCGEGKLKAVGQSQGNLEHGKNQCKGEDAFELPHLDNRAKKVGQSASVIGQANANKIKSSSQMGSVSENQEKEFARQWKEREDCTQAQATMNQEEKRKTMPTHMVKENNTEDKRKTEAVQPPRPEEKLKNQKSFQQVNAAAERKEKTSGEVETERMKREREIENERLRKIEEEREREREREKDRMAVDLATLEARERAFADSRDRSERVAVERLTAEARQRAMSEARERLEKACAEAREKSLSGKAAMEARIRAERSAVERATAEARERAAEKAMAERAACEARERVQRSVSDKFAASTRNNVLRQSSSSSDLLDGSHLRHQYSSVYGERFEGAEVESAQRCKARLERHRRTAERAAKALAEKNMRDLLAQREQAERNRLAETLDADVKRWSSGKEGNLRALLSTLQYILGPDSCWHPIPLTEVITSAAVKKAYRKATLCVHPDKLQQRGASIHQKYICEKVFDLLKEAWNKFNSEER